MSKELATNCAGTMFEQRENAGTIVVHTIAKHQVTLNVEGVMSPSPYSLLLASHLPNLHNQSVLDVGTGSGILAIVARKQGARSVYLLDIDDRAISTALDNAARNNVEGGIVALSPGDLFSTLPGHLTFDAIISNPPQIPKSDQGSSQYFGGRDGRSMIDRLVNEAPAILKPGGRLLFTQTSLADYPLTEKRLTEMGLKPEIVSSMDVAFRSFYEQAYFDSLGGVSRGLYKLKQGVPFETVHVIEATKNS